MKELSGNFQIGAAQKAENGAASMALGAFYFRASDNRGKFLFLSWGADDDQEHYTGFTPRCVKCDRTSRPSRCGSVV
jgi:hypothetical protein